MSKKITKLQGYKRSLFCQLPVPTHEDYAI